jgi:hypothetical protein
LKEESGYAKTLSLIYFFLVRWPRTFGAKRPSCELPRFHPLIADCSRYRETACADVSVFDLRGRFSGAAGNVIATIARATLRLVIE